MRNHTIISTDNTGSQVTTRQRDTMLADTIDFIRELTKQGKWRSHVIVDTQARIAIFGGDGFSDVPSRKVIQNWYAEEKQEGV